MTLSLFGYLIADAEPPSGGAAPRLRDLIGGLVSGDIAGASILARLDPNLSDEIRAVVAHRGMTLETFLANALLAFALDVADDSWRQAIKFREAVSTDAEAAAFADLLTEILRQRLEREISIGWEASWDVRPQSHTLARRIG